MDCGVSLGYIRNVVGAKYPAGGTSRRPVTICTSCGALGLLDDNTGEKRSREANYLISRCDKLEEDRIVMESD